MQRDRDMLVGQLVPAENTDWSESAAVQQVVGEETSEIGRYLKYKVTDVAVAALAWYLFKTFQNRKPLSQFTYSRALRHLHRGHLRCCGHRSGSILLGGSGQEADALVAQADGHPDAGGSCLPSDLPNAERHPTTLPRQQARADDRDTRPACLLRLRPAAAHECFLKWAPGSDKTGQAEDDRRNDRLAKQSIDAHKVLGKVLQYVWLPFHLDYSSLYHYSQGRGVVRKVSPFI